MGEETDQQGIPEESVLGTGRVSRGEADMLPQVGAEAPGHDEHLPVLEDVLGEDERGQGTGREIGEDEVQ